MKSDLEEWETSYRQFLERHTLGEGSYRRFFGREFAEPAACEGRLAKGSKVWTENPMGRQLSPIFWQRIKSVPDGLSFVQGPGTGEWAWRSGRAAIANLGRGVPGGKAAFADFLADNLPSLPLARAGSQREARYGRVPKNLPKRCQKGSKMVP